MPRTTILHVTDTHSAAQAGRRAWDVLEAGGYDMAVCTGDVVSSGYDDEYTLIAGGEGYPLCLGNHDVTSSLDWQHPHGQADIVSKYHLDDAANPCGISRDGWSWWHRDVNDVTVLGVNTCMVDGYEDQYAWLRAQLNRCIDGGRRVVLCGHIFDSSQTHSRVQCSFTNPLYALDTQFIGIYPTVRGISSILSEAVSRGLRVAFCCWGHDHSDELEVTDGRVKNFVLGSTVCDGYNDLIRTSDGGRSSSCLMNLYVIDTDAKVLDVVRIGARNSATGRERRRIRMSLDGADVIGEW